MSERVVDVHGRKVGLIEQGDGEPLVYLHGFADVHSLTSGLQPFHQRLAESAKLIAPAHPGCAGSAEPGEGYDLDDVLFHYLELFDALGLKTFDLVGHCVGGWLAAELAVRHPEKIRRLALIGACGLFVPGEPIGDVFMYSQPARGVDYASLRNLLFSSATAPVGQRFYPDVRGDPDDEVRHYQMLRLGAFIGFKPPYFYNRALRGRLHRAAMPACVIWGEHDRMVPPAHGRAYSAGLADAKPLEIVEGAGHAAPLEAPEKTAELVIDFLRRK